MRDFQRPGRSLVVATGGMAATSHPASSLAAIRILDAGGNAVDAAIAACAVQCVVEPGSTGIGGDCFALIAEDGADVVAYNGSGRAPAAASADALTADGLAAVPRQSPHAVTIPGAIDAWCRLNADHGRLPMADVLAPAIGFAEAGYAVSPRVHHDWTQAEGLLAADPAARRIYLPGGTAPPFGAVHRLPELGGTLRAIARDGRDAFYTGPVAEDMVETLRKIGGVHTLDDFASAAGAYADPVRTRFRDHEVHECPPNGQGIIALMILNILARFPAEGDPVAADRLQIEIEASRLAYAARDAVLADPDHMTATVDHLLSDALADDLAGRIDPGGAPADVPSFREAAHSDTVCLSVVDRDRLTVSFINSLFSPYGSGIAAPRSGVLFQNRGRGFVLEDGHPNRLAGGKRPLHTIIPGLVTRDGRAVMPFGVMGGHYQATGHGHFVSKVLDYGLDMQAAIDLPRLFPLPGTRTVEVEDTVPPATRAELARRGYEVVPAGRALGGAQAVWIDRDQGTLVGASDPRKDGCALGL